MAASLCRVWEQHLDCVGFLLPHTQCLFERLHRLASLLLKSVRKNARTSEGSLGACSRIPCCVGAACGRGCQSNAHLKLLALAFFVGRFDALAAEAVNERLPCLIFRQLAHATLHRVAAQSSLQRKDVCSRACTARVHHLQPPFVCVIHADEVPVAGFGRRLLSLEDDAALHTPCPVRLGSAARACTGLTLRTFCPVSARAPLFPVCSQWNSYGSSSFFSRSPGAGASEKKASKQPDVSGLSFTTLTETETAADRGVSLSSCAWLFDSFDFFFPSFPIAWVSAGPSSLSRYTSFLHVPSLRSNGSARQTGAMGAAG